MMERMNIFEELKKEKSCGLCDRSTESKHMKEIKKVVSLCREELDQQLCLYRKQQGNPCIQLLPYIPCRNCTFINEVLGDNSK